MADYIYNLRLTPGFPCVSSNKIKMSFKKGQINWKYAQLTETNEKSSDFYFLSYGQFCIQNASKN